MDENFPKDGCGQLPIFDHIADEVYKRTDAPQDLEECIRMVKVLKSEITDIQIQLAKNKITKDNIHWFNGDLQAHRQWRYKTKQALRLKLQQIFLLEAWREEHYPSPPPPPVVPRIYYQLEEQVLNEDDRFSRGEFKRLMREVKFLRRAISEVVAAIASGDETAIELYSAKLSGNDAEVRRIEALMDDALLNAENKARSV